MNHKLKTIQPFFGDVEQGIKTFEVRKNDRNFQVNDTLTLQHYIPSQDRYTGREIRCRVVYMLSDETYCKDGFVILGIEKIKSSSRTIKYTLERMKDGEYSVLSDNNSVGDIVVFVIAKAENKYSSHGKELRKYRISAQDYKGIWNEWEGWL
jgi:hypothetical protein